MVKIIEEDKFKEKFNKFTQLSHIDSNKFMN